MDLFLLKKITGVLLMPMSMVLILFLMALIFHRSKPQFSFKCSLIGFILLLFASFTPLSDRALAPIEEQYDTFTRSSQPIDYIVILGCGHTSDATLVATSELKACSLQRLVEGLRIFRLHPEATIITSGAAFGDRYSNAEKVKQAALLLGVPEQKVLVEPFPRDTEEEAALISPRVKGTRVVLVTNANHMPRAINYFLSQGVEAMPAPASPIVKGLNDEKGWGYYVPNAKTLQNSTLAWYEYLGLAVQWLKSL
ncbi:ElyC/SanA/YdcF family protein [Thalassotalea ganghwensis]